MEECKDIELHCKLEPKEYREHIYKYHNYKELKEQNKKNQ